jgi:hypothetical protein
MLVKIMRAGGKQLAEVAKALDVAPNTLKRHCKAELEQGKHEIDAKVMGALVKAALSGNVTAQIFYLKTRCQWSELARLDEEGDGALRRFVVSEIPPKDEQRS